MSPEPHASQQRHLQAGELRRGHSPDPRDDLRPPHPVVRQLGRDGDAREQEPVGRVRRGFGVGDGPGQPVDELQGVREGQRRRPEVGGEPLGVGREGDRRGRRAVEGGEVGPGAGVGRRRRGGRRRRVDGMTGSRDATVAVVVVGGGGGAVSAVLWFLAARHAAARGGGGGGGRRRGRERRVGSFPSC